MGKIEPKESKTQRLKDQELGESDDAPESHRAVVVVVAVRAASDAIAPVAARRIPCPKVVAAVGRGR